MIRVATRLQVADNSGAKVIECINVPGGTGKRYATIGEIIIASVKQAAPAAQVKKGRCGQGGHRAGGQALSQG